MADSTSDSTEMVTNDSDAFVREALSPGPGPNQRSFDGNVDLEAREGFEGEGTGREEMDLISRINGEASEPSRRETVLNET